MKLREKELCNGVCVHVLAVNLDYKDGENLSFKIHKSSFSIPSHFKGVNIFSTSTMKFITLPTFVLLTLSHFALNAAANSGYAASCNSIGILTADSHNSDNLITGNCRETSGIYNVGPEININSCFINSGGNLVAQVK